MARASFDARGGILRLAELSFEQSKKMAGVVVGGRLAQYRLVTGSGFRQASRLMQLVSFLNIHIRATRALCRRDWRIRQELGKER